jgi:uncharacterized protein (TIGR00251 family)
MSPDAIVQDGGDVLVRVLVVPNASASSIVGLHGDRIRVRVAAPPEKGRANVAVCELLSAVTGARSVDVVAGGTSRRKTVRVCGMSSTDVVGLLGVDA